MPARDTMFSYAYVDARDRGATVAPPNTPAEMTPRHAAPDPLRLASFHRFAAGARYHGRTWRVAPSIENLTPECFLLAGSTGIAFRPVNPRSAGLRFSRSW